MNKNFLSFVQTIRFRLDQNLPKSFILNQSLSWYCLLKIVLNPDSSAPSERAGVCREKDQMSTFYRTYLLKVSYELKTPLHQVHVKTCQGFQLEKMVIRKKCKVSEVFTIKILCVLKVLFSKM